jgi:hypothetical protein
MATGAVTTTGPPHRIRLTGRLTVTTSSDQGKRTDIGVIHSARAHSGRSRATLEKRRAQIEQWIAEEPSPIREVELIQQRLDIDAQLAQVDQAQRLAALEKAFVEVAASWAKRSGIGAPALCEVGVPAGVLKRAGRL